MSARQSPLAPSNIQSPSGATVSSDSAQRNNSVATGGPSPKSTNSSFTSPNPSTNVSDKPAVPKSDLNQRSCVTCRRRKVRCNKRDPCSNCVKAGIECVFPGPGRAPRKPRRPPDAELLARLRRLEGVVESLGGQAAIDRLNTRSSPPLASGSSPAGPGIGSNTSNDKPQNPTSAPSDCPTLSGTTSGRHPFLEADPVKIQERQSNKMHEELGRLVIDEGRSKYVSNRFWASIGDQIEEMQDLLDPISSEEEEYESPEASTQSSGSSGHLAFFNYQSAASSLRDYHPLPTQQFLLWKTFQENVVPWVSIFHVPSLREVLFGVAASDPPDKNAEALVFAVYMAAVISLTSAQCLRDIGEEREALVTRYRFATEQALARANLLNSQNLTLLQAATLFLTCVRREDDSRFVWTMTAVLVRLATGLGAHRDGSKFGLTAFETEMRRRLWWHICILDNRASEDHGTDPMIHDAMYDTRLPSNINDDDINPDSKEIPPDRVGFTDMTSALIRCEVTLTYRRLTFTPPGFACPRVQTLEERAQMIEELNARLNERYIKHCNMDEPLQWVCATVARIIVARLWLIIHHPLTNKDQVAPLSQEMRTRLLRTSVEVLEFSHLLKTNEKTAKWGWLFRTYVQWHAVAFVLAELCVRPPCPGVDRAWVAVNAVFNDYEAEITERKSAPWRSLYRLMKRARAFREKQQAQLQTEFGAAPVNDSSRNLQQAARDGPSAYVTPKPPFTEPWSSANVHVWSSPSATSDTVPSLPGAGAGVAPAVSAPSHAGYPKIDLQQGMTDLLGTMIHEGKAGDPFDVSLDDIQVPAEHLIMTPDIDLSALPMEGLDVQQDFTGQEPWDQQQWDTLMREFQMEVEQNGQNTMGDFGTWIG